MKAELRSQSRPTSLKSRRPESQERCRTIHRQHPRLPTCPLIPTASQRNHRLTSRVAPSLRGRRKARKRPCKCENRGLASRGTSVWPVREPPSGGFSLGLSVASKLSAQSSSLDCSAAPAEAGELSVVRDPTVGSPHVEAYPLRSVWSYADGSFLRNRAEYSIVHSSGHGR